MKKVKRYDSYYSIRDKEVCLLDKKLNGVIDGGLYWVYSECLYSEYGSAIKIMNHIEMNVGLDRFKAILDYANTKNISGEEFIEFMNNNDKVIPEIVNENKDDGKKLTVDYIYLVCGLFSLVNTIYLLYSSFYYSGYNLYVTMFFSLLNFINTFICVSRTFKYKKIC